MDDFEKFKPVVSKILELAREIATLTDTKLDDQVVQAAFDFWDGIFGVNKVLLTADANTSKVPSWLLVILKDVAQAIIKDLLAQK